MTQPLNPVRPGTQAELTAMLANTIGAEAEAAMNGVNWEHTETPPQTPVNPANATAPTPPPEGQKAEANPTAQPTAGQNPIDWNAYKDPTGLILGKYRDPDSAVKGMHSLLHMAKEALRQKEQAELEIGQLRQQLTKPTAESVPSTSHDTEYQLPELELVRQRLKAGEGLDADDALKLVDGLVKYSEVAAQKAQEKFTQQRNQETEAWKNVESYMSQHYPDSVSHVDEMDVFRRTNSEVGRVFNRLLAGSEQDPGARLDATIYLWKEFQASNPGLATPIDPANAQAQEAQLSAQAQVRKELVDQARIDAGLYGTSAAGAHETTQQGGVTQADIDSAARYMKQTADGRLWREMTIGRTLTGPLFET